MPGRISLSLIAFILLLGLFWYGIGSVSSQTDEKQLESLREAVERDVVHCYAVEGGYPPSLDYLKDHYGLTYDENRYLVDYIYEGSNIYPDITILEK